MDNTETHYDSDEGGSFEEFMMRPRWCTSPDCIFPDPMHSPGECYSVDDAEEYHKKGMRDSDEYRLAIDECLAVVEKHLSRHGDVPLIPLLERDIKDELQALKEATDE